MKSRELARNDSDLERTFVLILEEEDEAFETITQFAEQNGLVGASLTAIGAFRRATLGFFEFGTKTYKEIPIDRQTEVLSAIGDIAIDDDGKASLHMHVVLGFSDASTKGGHFVNGEVFPTLEVIVRETGQGLRRKKRDDL